MFGLTSEFAGDKWIQLVTESILRIQDIPDIFTKISESIREVFFQIFL